MGRWLREPLLRFFAVGGLFFVAYRFLAVEPGETVSLSDEGVSILLAEYEAVTGRSPDEAQRQAIIDDYYRREVLYREGLRERIFETDARLREAIIERMQQRVSGELGEPDGRDLVNYYAEHIDRYYREPSMSVEQRFLDTAPGAEEARALLAALHSGDEPSFAPAPGGNTLPGYGESVFRARFGADVLDALRELPLHQWAGPFESAVGWHFFRVLERQPRELLPFERVQAQVRADYQAAILAERVDRFVEARRPRYPFMPSR
jgi:hypothetical protein